MFCLFAKPNLRIQALDKSFGENGRCTLARNSYFCPQACKRQL